MSVFCCVVCVFVSVCSCVCIRARVVVMPPELAREQRCLYAHAQY
jgi:hypothetical protein